MSGGRLSTLKCLIFMGRCCSSSPDGMAPVKAAAPAVTSAAPVNKFNLICLIRAEIENFR